MKVMTSTMMVFRRMCSSPDGTLWLKPGFFPASNAALKRRSSTDGACRGTYGGSFHNGSSGTSVTSVLQTCRFSKTATFFGTAASKNAPSLGAGDLFFAVGRFLCGAAVLF